MENQNNTTKSDVFSYLKPYSKFENVDAMDAAIKQHKYLHQNSLNKTDLALLDCLARYSLRHPGVSTLKSTTILKEINKTSTKTVTRITKKLADLRIIEVHKTQKTDSSKTMNLRGANIFAILPFENFIDQKCLNENVPTKMSQRTNGEKPQYNNAQSNISEQQSFNSLSSNSLKKNSLNNTYRTKNVSSEEKKDLYTSLEQLYRAKTENQNKSFNEFIKIIGGNYNKFIDQLGLDSLQKILTETMVKVLKSTNVRSDFRLYSNLVKKAIDTFLVQKNGNTSLTITSSLQTNYKSQFGRTEFVPDWFDSRNKPVSNTLNEQEQVDLELRRKQLFEKHGDLFKAN